MQKALTAKSVENGQNSVENASKYRRIKRQTQPEVALRRQARGQVAGIARSMSRKIAIKAFAAGDKVCPFYLRTLASNYTSLPVSQRSNAGSRPGSPPQSRAGSSARTKQTKKPAGFVAAGSGRSALSAGLERQDNRKRKSQTCAKTNRTQ
jgi:hypothetical protein